MTRLLTALALCLPLAAQAGDGILAAIQKSGTIRLGHLHSAPPFSFVDSDGKPQGYSVELCKRVAEDIRQELKVAELKIEWVQLQQQDRIEAVRNRKVNIECGTTTWTLTRQQEVDFSLMTFVDGATVRVNGNSEMLRIADLNGKKIAVVPTTTTATSLQRALKARMLTAEVVLVNSPEEGIGKLKSGAVDGYASDRVVLIGLGLQSKTGSTFRANACLKASSYATQFNTWALADDSGLEVDALKGAPGVRSARYAADEHGAPEESGNSDDEANNARLLRELHDRLILQLLGAKGGDRAGDLALTLLAIADRYFIQLGGDRL